MLKRSFYVDSVEAGDGTDYVTVHKLNGEITFGVVSMSNWRMLPPYMPWPLGSFLEVPGDHQAWYRGKWGL